MMQNRSAWKMIKSKPQKKLPPGIKKTDFLNRDLINFDKRNKSAFKQRTFQQRSKSQTWKSALQTLEILNKRQTKTSAKPPASTTKQNRQRSAPMFSMKQIQQNYNQIVQQKKQSTLKQVLPKFYQRSKTPDYLAQAKPCQSIIKRSGSTQSMMLESTRLAAHQRSKSAAVPKRRAVIQIDEIKKALKAPAPRRQAHANFDKLIAEQGKQLKTKHGLSLPHRLETIVSNEKPSRYVPWAPRASQPELEDEAQTKSCTQKSQNSEKVQNKPETDKDLQVVQLEVVLNYVATDGQRIQSNCLFDILLPMSASRPNFKKYLGSIPIQDSLDIGLKFYQNPDQKLENNLQILKIIQNYQNLIKNQQSSITFDELHTKTIFSFIDSKTWLKRHIDTIKFCILIQTETVPSIGQITQRAHELSICINWNFIDQRALNSVCSSLGNTNEIHNFNERATFGESELIRMMIKEQLIQRQCHINIDSSQYLLIENLNSNKQSPYPYNGTINSNRLPAMRKKLLFGGATEPDVTDGLNDSNHINLKFIPQISTQIDEHNKKIVINVFNQDLDDVETTHELSQNQISQEILEQGSDSQILVLKNLHRNELVQRYGRFCKKSSTMNFASPQQSERQNLLHMQVNTESIDYPYYDEEREQIAPEQELEITQSLSLIQSEIQNLQNASPLSLRSQTNFGLNTRSQNNSFIRQININQTNIHCNTVDREVQDSNQWQDGGIQINKQISQNIKTKQIINKCDTVTKELSRTEFIDNNCFNLLQLSGEFKNETFESIDTRNDQDHLTGSSQYCESNAFAQDPATRHLSKSLRRRQQMLIASSGNVSNLVKNFNQNFKDKSQSLENDIHRQSIYKSKHTKNRFGSQDYANYNLKRSVSQEVNVQASEGTLQQEDLLPNIRQIQNKDQSKLKIRPNSVSMFGSSETESRIMSQDLLNGTHKANKSKYQQMFVKSGHQQNKALNEREQFQKSSNFNERLAMSILNSPNSYGSNANARIIIKRTQQNQLLQDHWIKQEFSKSANSSGFNPINIRGTVERKISGLNSNHHQNELNQSIDFQDFQNSYNNRNIFQMKHSEPTDPARMQQLHRAPEHIDYSKCQNNSMSGIQNISSVLAQYNPHKDSSGFNSTSCHRMSQLPSQFLQSSFNVTPGTYTPPVNKDLEYQPTGGNLETGNFGQQWPKLNILQEIQPDMSNQVINRQKQKFQKQKADKLSNTLNSLLPTPSIRNSQVQPKYKNYQKFTKFLENEQKLKSQSKIAQILGIDHRSDARCYEDSRNLNSLLQSVPLVKIGSSLGTVNKTFGTVGTIAGPGFSQEFKSQSQMLNSKNESIKQNSFKAANLGNSNFTGVSHASAYSQVPVSFIAQIPSDFQFQKQTFCNHEGDSPLTSNSSPFPSKKKKQGKENKAPTISLSLFKRN